MGRATLETNVPFSQSILWKLQSDAYTGFGVGAWREKGVPNYLTSHPITARGYVKTALAFLRDLKNDQPVTIIDIGAGTGKLAYLFLKDFLPSVDVPVRYIVTDIAQDNLDFIKEHPLMQDYPIELMRYRHDDQEWQSEIASFEGPVIAIANYYFDTVPQTLYKAQNGEVYEGRVTTTVPEECHTGGADMIPHLECSYTFEKAAVPDYVREYAKVLQDGAFMVPTGGLETISFIRKQSPGPLLWLMADQGVCTLSQARNFTEPKIARHGTFSVTVSYHFLQWYFEQVMGGAVMRTDNPDPAYLVMAATLGCERAKETAMAFRESLNELEPIDYFRMSNAVPDDAPLDAILALIRIGGWDPINAYFFTNRIRETMADADRNTKDRLIYTLDRVSENFYPISKEEAAFLATLGMLFAELGEVDRARSLAEQAQRFN